MAQATRPDRTAADRLIDATLESIHRHGLVETTVTTVTEIAGLSRGMVRHEFGSKDQMIVEAMSRVCETWLAETEPDPDLSGPEQVRAIVRAMFAPSVYTSQAIDTWLALSVEARSTPALRRLRDRSQDRWLDQLAAAFAASDVAEPELAAVGLLAAADGLWLRQRLDDRAMSRNQALAATVRIADALLSSSNEEGR
ncbi:MAG: TetR family transcriptional regulator C-terminal domain-containing protein [Actinomycetota bacterium]